MKIDSITIEGIANIEHICLQIGTINALIAPNGYGKSNVLRAIDFGVKFMQASESERLQKLNSRFLPINISIPGKDFLFEICGSIENGGQEELFQYGYTVAWKSKNNEGHILSEWLKIKSPTERRYKQLISRQSFDQCFIVPSASGRCTKKLNVGQLQLAIQIIAGTNSMYLNNLSSQIYNIAIPNIETLDNPESYFSAGANKGIAILEGMTLSKYLYTLKQNDHLEYSMLKDGILQLIPGICEFSPEAITMADGQTKIYDVRIKETKNTTATSIQQLSSGSKRIIFLFTLCIAAKRNNIPLIMIEEPENSIHPRLMENLISTLLIYSSDTRILMTSHSPYLMRYLSPNQMYFGLPKHDGLAHFHRINPSKIKYIKKYASDMELTIGEFMFDFMLDMEDDAEKIDTFFE